MDTVTVFFEGMSVVFGFLLLLFIPGFALSLVIFPRSTDLSIIDRLEYSTVLSISSSIVLVLFMEVVLGLDTTLGNFVFVVGVFSVIVLLFWGCERWYLNRRLKKNMEPQHSENNQNLQRYYSRGINAAKDQFRGDTRTVIIYHESRQSGINHIDHSYLMEIGEEINIQQVAENKLKVTDSYILEPPYPQTRYFELVILEYKEEGLSQVDDLQIYPVLVTKNPDRKFPDTALNQDTLQITERIYQKTSTTEVQWIYSHDFHIFAIIHEEDALDQMVDRILGKLDEIVTSTKSGVHISSRADDRQILRDAFDAVMQQPRGTPSQPQKIPRLHGFQPGVQSKTIPGRPVILPIVQQGEIPTYVEGQISAEPKERSEHPLMLINDERKEIPQQGDIQPGFELKKKHEFPVHKTGVEPKDIPARPEVQPLVFPKGMPDFPVLNTSVEPKDISQSMEIQPRVLPNERHEFPVHKTGFEPIKIPMHPEVQPRVQSKDILTHPENKLVVDSIRKLQKDILRDLDMFGLNSESFKKSKKNIEYIQIPKKADVNKKLADLKEEMLDLDWLYE